MASTAWHGQTLRLWEIGPLQEPSAAGAPGTIVRADAAGIDVFTGDGVLRITRLQSEGGKILAAGDFLNGHRLTAGDRLGDETNLPSTR